MLSPRAIATQGFGFSDFLVAVQGFGTEVSAERTIEYEFNAPRFWWQRKPKSLSEQYASVLMRKAVKAIAKKAVEHAEEPEPAAQRIAEVRQVVAPMLPDMPGFDWRRLYEAAYQRALTLAIAQALAEHEARAAIAKAKRLDETEIALLMLML